MLKVCKVNRKARAKYSTRFKMAFDNKACERLRLVVYIL